MNPRESYRAMAKPHWAPPSWLFSVVWTPLYVIIVATYGTVFYDAANGKLPGWVALLFGLNLLVNFAFVPLQFGLKNHKLAAADALLIAATLVAALLAVEPYLLWVVIANIPQLIWICFAVVLQLSVARRNR